MNYPFVIFFHHKHRKTRQRYREIVRKPLALLNRWEDFLPIRSRIDDIFNLGKGAFALKAVHKYLRSSVTIFVVLKVFPMEAIVLVGVDKILILIVAKWRKSERTI
jgi:hypothetical protein